GPRVLLGVENQVGMACWRLVDVYVSGERVKSAADVQLQCRGWSWQRPIERFGKAQPGWKAHHRATASRRKSRFAGADSAASFRNSAATSVMTEAQSPGAGWRNSRAVGYHGESVRPSNQRQSGECVRRIQTGNPRAPARCALAVSTEISRSRLE